MLTSPSMHETESVNRMKTRINTKYKKQISTNVDINTAHEKTAKKQTKHEADLALLAEHGIDGQIAEDFLTIRKAKRSSANLEPLG